MSIDVKDVGGWVTIDGSKWGGWSVGLADNWQAGGVHVQTYVGTQVGVQVEC